jgi:tight adherence protein B
VTADTLAVVAGVARRIAVLLAAGVAPASAWRHLAATTSSPVVASAARAENSAIPDVLSAAATAESPLVAEAWRGVAVAWTVATEAGSPLAPALRAYAGSLRDLARVERDARVALAAPVATSRLVIALPPLGMLFGLALGFDTLGILLTTPIGWVCLVLGGSLIAAAVRWNRALLRRARPPSSTPGLECELTAIAMAGGVSIDRAREIVAHSLARHGIASRPSGIDEVLELSRRAGVPAAELLRAEAEEQRAQARAEAEERAARLSVTLMLPLGLCVLPAFMLLGVVPLLTAVVSSTVGSF